jgi:hypothetical protein
MSFNRREHLVGIVVDQMENSKTQDGGVRVWFPHYGNNVKLEDLPTVPRLSDDPTNFTHPPEPYTSVLVQRDTSNFGSGACTIVGQLTDVHKTAGSPGNFTLNEFITSLKNARSKELKISVPPNIKDGDKRTIQEKGQKHSYKLLEGIPSHAALYAMAGAKLPTPQNVSTAIQQFNSVLSPSILSQLPGMPMSLGNMFNMLQGALFNQIMDKLPRELQAGLENMNILIQGVEAGEGSFNTSGRVNPDVFLNNAVNLLSQSSSIADIVGTMQRLQSDTSLFGLETLAAVNIPIKTPFGDVSISVDASGAVQSLIPEPVQKAIGAFSTLLSSPTQFPGVVFGQNMFGGASQVMSEVSQRLSPEFQQVFKDRMETAIASGSAPRTKLNDIMKKINTGIDVLS